MTRPVKGFLIGAVLVAAYIAVGVTAPFGPTRPLLDAIGPQQPYQWVNPDPLFAGGNRKPHSVTLTVQLDASGSQTPSIATPDGQAGLVLPPGAFPTKAGESKISVVVDPLDPMTIGPPPTGMRYDGNAYRFTATYAKSKTPAALTKTATIVLRFPILATKIYRRDGEAWTELKATPLGASQQIYADTAMIGTFVAASLPLEDTTKKKKSFPTALVISIAAAVVAAGAGLIARLRGKKRRRRSQSRTQPPRKQPPRKRPPPRKR